MRQTECDSLFDKAELNVMSVHNVRHAPRGERV